MSWIEIVIEVARDQADALSDALMSVGALSVTVEDADQDTDAEQPLFGEPGMEPEKTAWAHSRVVVLAALDVEPSVLLAAALNESGVDLALQDLLYTVRPVAEQDWVRETQAQFAPIAIGKNIWVVPSWHDAPDPNALVLELDPGLAFGTGSHPTTRLCMEWLEQHAPRGLTVLDYGCGSGILAVLAKKLGAAQVVGVDIDPQALEAARYNSERNRCAVDYCLPEQLFGDARMVHAPSAAFDVVVANILSSPLITLAAALAGCVKKPGALVLSGILEQQAEQVIAAYKPFIDLSVWNQRDEWVALSGRIA